MRRPVAFIEIPVVIEAKPYPVRHRAVGVDAVELDFLDLAEHGERGHPGT